jgi:hypothetical protein
MWCGELQCFSESDFTFSRRRVWGQPSEITWCLRQYAPLKRRSASTRVHGVISQMAIISGVFVRVPLYFLNKTTYVLFFLLSLLSKLFSYVHICRCILKLQHMFVCRYKIETLRNFQWFRCWYPKRWILDLCHISHGPLNYVAGGFISLQ